MFHSIDRLGLAGQLVQLKLGLGLEWELPEKGWGQLVLAPLALLQWVWAKLPVVILSPGRSWGR